MLLGLIVVLHSWSNFALPNEQENGEQEDWDCLVAFPALTVRSLLQVDLLFKKKKKKVLVSLIPGFCFCYPWFRDLRTTVAGTVQDASCLGDPLPFSWTVPSLLEKTLAPLLIDPWTDRSLLPIHALISVNKAH